MIDLPKNLLNCRYADTLLRILKDPKLDVRKVERLRYSSDWDGFVDIVVSLDTGKLLRFKYNYTSTKSDPWNNLNAKELEDAIWKTAETYNSLEEICETLK